MSDQPPPKPPLSPADLAGLISILESLIADTNFVALHQPGSSPDHPLVASDPASPFYVRAPVTVEVVNLPSGASPPSISLASDSHGQPAVTIGSRLANT